MTCGNFLITIATVLPSLIFVTETSMKYGRCNVYMDANLIPDLPDTDRYCIVLFDDVLVCREWRCPRLTCPATRTPGSHCPVCAGMCVHNGQVYTSGETFFHADRVNRCRCHGRNRFYCHKIASTPEYMCFH